MWFVLSLLTGKAKSKIFRVSPIINNNTGRWKGFGISNAQMLEQAYSSKIPFTTEDIRLGYNFWNACKIFDFKKLKELSRQQSICFQHLNEVCQAHIERFPADNSLGRPDKIVKAIMENKAKGSQEVFSEFSDRQGIYGFCNSQVKNIYDRQFSSTR